jgi:hypothetical protein
VESEEEGNVNDEKEVVESTRELVPNKDKESGVDDHRDEIKAGEEEDEELEHGK